MATRLYGISRGEAKELITEAAGSATTDNMELTVDLAAGLTREDAVLMLDKLAQYILEGDWPPA
jgi:hypothetical protein